MKYQDITANYIRRLAIHHARLNRIKQLEQRIQKLKSIPGPSWINMIIEPLSKELSKELSKHLDICQGVEYEILGPFGICAATSIHFFKKGSDHDKAYSLEGGFKSLTFIPVDLARGKLKIRDESTDTGEFEQGTN